MRDGVICEITEANLDTGLRGIPVGHCYTSSVDPMKGLMYDCYPIAELSSRDPIEIIYLLMHGEIGSQGQVKNFEEQIAARSQCKPETLQHIQSAVHPGIGHPMDVFATALLIAGMHEGTDDYAEDCLNVIAKIPQIVATVMNTHAGWGATPPSNPSLGYMENFLHMLKFPGERRPELAQVLRLFDVTHFDHDGGNLSTFVGKAISSGREHMWGSLAGAMTALAGPLHGRANQECLEFAKEVLDSVGPNASALDVERWVRRTLGEGNKVYGFGHAVLRVEDPRAAVFYSFAQKHFGNDPLVKIALHLRTEGTKVLKENPKIQNPYPNIDAITGSVLTAAGFTFSDYYTVLFGLSRCVGIAIQIVDERTIMNEGKGSPIVRPNFFWQQRKR